MTTIVFLDRATIGPSVRLHRPGFAHDWRAYDSTRPEDIIARASDAQIVITNKVPLNAQTLAQLPRLRMIAVAATGVDIIDTRECAARGIALANVRGYAVNTVPEHVFALALALSRSLTGYRQDVVDGAWQRAEQFTFFNHGVRDLAGATLGIIGVGAIGQAVARLGEAFGMNVLLSGRKGQDASALEAGRTPFAQVLAQSDVITLHCPLTPETHHLIGREEFAQMARRPILINTGRGGLVDEAAAVEALDAGQVSGLGFDCLTSEPPRAGNPLLAIAGRPNVIITPHMAWASDSAMQALWDQVIANIEGFWGEAAGVQSAPRS